MTNEASTPAGLVVWLTGLPASGKSTLANALRLNLEKSSVRACIIDGDELRSGLCSDLGFSEQDRRENVRRAAEVARFVCQQGLVAIVALVSPYQRDRMAARQRVGPGRFIQVHVECPVEVCRQRDPKGLYRLADQGVILEFTGISAPYEKPSNPELHLRTDTQSVGALASRLTQAVRRRI